MSALFYSKRQLIITGIATILAGTILHFLYKWVPNAVTALFSPINESIWEHVKILFWPYLAAAALLNRGRPGGIRPWLLVLIPLCMGMLLLGYGYHIILGGEAMWVDVAICIGLMALGFWLPTQFSGPFQGVKWMIPVILASLLAVMIGVFTLWPPDHILFVDLSSASAWFQIPH